MPSSVSYDTVTCFSLAPMLTTNDAVAPSITAGAFVIASTSGSSLSVIVKVKLSNPVNATLATDGTLATGTITDNDEPEVLAITNAPAVIEGATASFVVSMGASEKQVTVSYETEDGTAEEPGDYTSTSGTLTFVAGATTKMVTVVTANDTVDEADGETFKVKLSNPVNATLATDGTLATGTITDNDDPTELSIGDATAVIEGGSALFVVSMGASEKQVTVSYETEDGTAEEPGDYTSTSGTLTFVAGATTKTVTVVTANDTVDEADGETFKVKLSNPVNATLATDGTLATGTITDNDDPTELSIGDATAVIEGGSALFVVSMGASEKQVTVSYETEDGTAEEPGDYTSTSGTLTFVAGATTKTVTVVTANDTVDEADGETFKVKLSNPVNATLATDGTLATGTITDNDDPTELSIGDATAVIEGGSALFVVSMGASEKQVTVSYETEDGTAEEPGDYTSTSGTLTFVAGATTKMVTVVTANDTVDEADGETFKVKLSNPVNATLATDGTLATGTITDNDVLSAEVSADWVSVDEGEDAVFTVSVEDGTSTADVVVEYAVDATSTATADEDYTAPSPPLTIKSGETSGKITIKTLDTDGVLDPGETLVVKLTSASTDTRTVTVDATAKVTTKIADDGTEKVSVRAVTVPDNSETTEVNEFEDESVVEEGESAMFVVALSGEVSSDVEVSYETSDDTGAGAAEAGEDYTAVSATTLTFTAGDTAKTVTVATLEDQLVEADETFTVKLTGVTAPDGVGVSLDEDADEATGTITDNDALHVSVAPEETTVDEGEIAKFIVTLSDSTRAADVVVTYEIDDTNSTATVDDDYEAPSSTTLTIVSGSSSGTIEIQTKTDNVLEEPEALIVTLQSASSTGGRVKFSTTPAEITINNATGHGIGVKRDGDPVGNSDSVQVPSTLRRSATAAEARGAANVDLVVNSDACNFPCMIEGTSKDSQDTETLTVFLTTDTEPPEPVDIEVGHSVVIPYATTDGTATGNVDYTALSGTLTFTSTAMEHSLTLKTIPDALPEEDETFTFTIHTADLPDMQQTVGFRADVRIQDDDTLSATDSGPKVTLSSPGSFPATGRFTVNIVFSESVTGFDSTGDITVTNGSARDLEGSGASYTVRITPRDEFHGHVTVTVPADVAVDADDAERRNVEGNKRFSVNTTTSPTVTIESWDDFPAHGAFDVTIRFSETVSGFTLDDIEVTNGTAGNLAGTDATYSVEITPEDDFAGDVIVTVPANAAFDDANNGNQRRSESFEVDTRLVQVDVSFGAATYTALEDGAPATVTVLLSADPERTLVIPLTVRNGKGASDADYSGVPNQVTFASGQTSTTFTVTATSDIDEDAGETVTLGFGELPAAVSTASPDRATITLAGESSKTRYARVMRTLLPRAAAAMSDATVGAISNRIDNVGSQGNLSLAGVNVLPSASVAAQERSADAISWASRDQTTRNISSAQLMDGSSFVMTLADRARLAGAADPSGSNPGTAALWGSGDYRNLAGSQNALAWRGNLVSLHLGADLVALPELVAGVAVARSLVGFDYTDRTNPRTVTGTFETDLLSVHPYASWTPTFGLGFWATGGVGWGGVGIDDNLDVRRTSTTRLLTGALGGSSRLLSVDGLIPGGATALRLKGEGFVTQTLAEENGPIVAQDVGVQRVRLALEGSHEQRGLWGSILTPALEVGLRHDGGDAAQGAGLELGGELRYVQPELGLTVEGRGRVLTTHRAATQEWGVGGKIQLELGADRQGLSLSLAPSLGVAASGTHTLWQQGVVPGSPLGLPSSGVTDVTSRLDAQADYGLLAMGGQGMLTPYGGFSLAGRAGRDYRAGARLETDTFNLSLEGMRSERDSGVVDHGLTVQGAIRF